MSSAEIERGLSRKIKVEVEVPFSALLLAGPLPHMIASQDGWIGV
jgi:hypothetical protein